MALLNLGGPGWFEDVFKVEVSIDGDRLTDCHSLLFQEKCPLASSEETMRGQITITPPENCSVWHNGIKLQLDWSVSYFETLSTQEAIAYETTLVEPGYISEPQQIPFELDLAAIADKFIETYDGEMFCIRHSLLVTVQRPWWTFDVLRSLVFAIHKIGPAPAVEEHVLDDDLILYDMHCQGEEASALAPEDQVPQHRLRVVDAAEGLVMHYERSCLNVGEAFVGTITVGGGNPEFLAGKIDPEKRCGPLVGLEVIIYKIETGDGDSNEVVLKIHDVPLEGVPVDGPGADGEAAATDSDAGGAAATDAGAQAASADAQAGADAPPTDAALATASVPAPAPPPAPPAEPKDYQVSITLDKSDTGFDMGPTIIDETLSVRYFVRLVARDAAGVSVWNTHEIVLYRANLHHETI